MILEIIITLIVGIVAIGLFALCEFKRWLETYEDSKDENRK